MTHAADPLLGQTLSGKFQILRPLGEGGMGAVYVAEHCFTKRKGALKLLHKSFSELPDVVERFIREASAAGVIGSPHIVETYDAGKLDTGEPYMFMELLDGAPVDELLERRGRLRFDEAATIASQAALGLAAAHEAGIVHRDVKPANLFLLRGPEPFVKLLDFGISKFAPDQGEAHDLTIEGRLLGTPLYMPPEQVNGQRDLDARADIYSLGVVLYEMLTGEVPFSGGTLMELSVRIHEGQYTPVSQVRPDTPNGFDQLIARALATDRDQRYRTARAFSAQLKGLIGRAADTFVRTSAADQLGSSLEEEATEKVVLSLDPEPTQAGLGPTVTDAPAANISTNASSQPTIDSEQTIDTEISDQSQDVVAADSVDNSSAPPSQDNLTSDDSIHPGPSKSSLTQAALPESQSPQRRRGLWLLLASVVIVAAAFALNRTRTPGPAETLSSAPTTGQEPPPSTGSSREAPVEHVQGTSSAIASDLGNAEPESNLPPAAPSSRKPTPEPLPTSARESPDSPERSTRHVSPPAAKTGRTSREPNPPATSPPRSTTEPTSGSPALQDGLSHENPF